MDSVILLGHCVKCVRIQSYSSPYFLAFRLNTKRYEVSLSILSPNAGKIWSRITANKDTCYTVVVLPFFDDLILSKGEFYS